MSSGITTQSYTVSFLLICGILLRRLKKRKILQWTLGSVAVITTCGRYYLRWQHFHETRLDDLFNGLALASLLTYFAICQAKWSNTDPIGSLKLWLAQNLLFWVCLYLVKATFLSLYWSIFNVSPTFRKVWWPVLVYNVVAFSTMFLGQLWQCGNPLLYADPLSCKSYSNRPAGVLSPSQTANFVFAFALHIVSDCRLVALPILFLKKLRMSRSRKISVAAVLGIGVIDTLLGLVRLIVLLCASLRLPSPTDIARDDTLNVMGGLEPTIAVIDSALPVYRVLLPPSRKSREHETELQRNIAAMATVATIELSQAPPSLTREANVSSWV